MAPEQNYFDYFNYSAFIHIVFTRQKIDLFDTPNISKYLNYYMEHHNYPNTIFDLRNVNYTDSAGFGLLISVMSKCKKNGNEVVLLCNKESMIDDLKVSGVTNFFSIFKNFSDAEKKFSHISNIS